MSDYARTSTTNYSPPDETLRVKMIHVANAQAALAALDQARAQLDDAIARVRDHLDKAARL